MSNAPSPEKGVAPARLPMTATVIEHIKAHRAKYRSSLLEARDAVWAGWTPQSDDKTARLRDAAPDLLTELWNTLGWVRHWGLDVTTGLMPTRSSLADVEASIKAAIARATEA